MSLLKLLFNFSGLLGAICGGFAYDRFNKIGVFVVIVIIMGISAALTPWCYHLAAMLVVHGFHGICAASLETGLKFISQCNTYL
jgi:predicted MFS family arabinose efflux permease